ncbi:TPA: hypothetical protein ACXHWU_002343 [Morganella morganii]
MAHKLSNQRWSEHRSDFCFTQIQREKNKGTRDE